MIASGYLHGPTDLRRKTGNRYPLDRRLAGPQTRPGQSVERENVRPRRKSNPDSPVIYPVA
jgi:hypothetical protein